METVNNGQYRLGNWVFNDGVPYMITELKISTAYCWMKPIPLTPEILLKAGAIWKIGKHCTEYYIGKLKFTYEINELSQFVRFHYSGKVAYLQYLHQLQNLYYALTGHDLTIIL